MASFFLIYMIVLWLHNDNNFLVKQFLSTSKQINMITHHIQALRSIDSLTESVIFGPGCLLRCRTLLACDSSVSAAAAK